MAGRRPHLLPPVAAATATWCAPALASIFPPAAAPLRIRTRAARGSRVVHVTFDDGPHPQATPAVLEILGSVTWKLPRWLDRRLPHFRIEGHGEPPLPPEEVFGDRDGQAGSERQTAEVGN